MIPEIWGLMSTSSRGSTVPVTTVVRSSVRRSARSVW